MPPPETGRLVYLDNAATSFPKPAPVIKAVNDYFVKIGANAGRSAHRRAAAASRLVFETRELIARLINAQDSSRIVFTLNATEALNLGLLGFDWCDGDQVITSSIEHNSVMRPLRFLEREKKVKLELVPCSADGRLDPKKFALRLKKRTRLVVLTHASNVIGSITPIKEAGRICRDRGVMILVDAAQTAGKIPIDVQRDNIDMVAFSGHKGLLGPPGIGCLYLRPGLNLRPLKFGGTGSRSQHDIQPDFMPDMFESGTLNLPGIAGLNAGAVFVLEQGIENIESRITHLTRRLLNVLSNIRRVVVYGPKTPVPRTGTVAFNVQGLQPCAVGRLLDERYNIAVRVGLHCSPNSHRTIGTYPEGTVRASVGFFNRNSEIDALGRALCQIAG